tara:strand:+ start:1401 stop:1910 length:510 start_codon:yes stop_codon:yes gene_type:complete
MRYLPFENITYLTKLELEEIQKRIDEVIEPEKTFRMTGIFKSSDHKPYEGTVDGNSFNITRIIGYRNSFLPKISGVIEKDLKGNKINVKMRLHVFVIVFMFIWFGICGVECLAVLAIGFNFFSQNFQPITLVPFGMLIFGYALVTLGFKYESIKSKKYLAELFEAEIEK